MRAISKIRMSSLTKNAMLTSSKTRIIASQFLRSLTSKQVTTEWNDAVSEAERIVGYPTSFMGLRCLLNDELSNIALQMRKLVGTKHPLLKMARHFVFDGRERQQTRGLLVLLLSKTAGPPPKQNNSEGITDDVLGTMVSGVYPRQRTLAEIVELIHTAYLVHRGVMNIETVSSADESVENLEFGNKMATLTGDYLLANASTLLAELHNTQVVEMMASSIRDQMSAEFSSFRDKDGHDILPDDSSTSLIDGWERLTFLSSGSLLSNACKGALMLGGHSDHLQNAAYNFGLNMAYARQLHEDMKSMEHLSKGTDISLIGAPVCLHVDNQKNGAEVSQLIQEQKYDQIRSMLIASGSDMKSRVKCEEYGSKALDALNEFPSSDAKVTLEKMVNAARTL